MKKKKASGSVQGIRKPCVRWCFTVKWHKWQCMIQTIKDRTGNTERQYRSPQPRYWRCCELVSPLPVLFALGNTALILLKKIKAAIGIARSAAVIYVISGYLERQERIIYFLTPPQCCLLVQKWLAHEELRGFIFLPLCAILSWFVQLEE